MNPLALETDAVVIGTLTTLRPDQVRPVLDRLQPADFPRWAAARALHLIDGMCEAGLASLDAATLVGYAQHTAAIPARRWPEFARFLTDAIGASVPATVLDFHVALLIEATYRRAYTAASARLTQAADAPDTTLTDLDAHLAAVTNDLDHHRARLRQDAVPLHLVTNPAHRGATA